MSKFNFRIIYRSEKQNIKLDNFTKKINNFLKNENDDRTQYRYCIIFKNSNFKKEVKYIIQLTSLFLDEVNENVIYLTTIIYEFNK